LYGDPRLLSFTLIRILSTSLLIIHGDDMTIFVTDEQRATGAVVDTLDTVNKVIAQQQLVVIRVTDGDHPKSCSVVCIRAIRYAKPM
jgi:hypothetical protein